MAGAGTFLLVPLLSALLLGLFALHRIEEGHVGVYWRGGALIPRVTQPGYHLKIPFIDSFENVQVTLQTDKVTDIPCGCVPFFFFCTMIGMRECVMLTHFLIIAPLVVS